MCTAWFDCAVAGNCVVDLGGMCITVAMRHCYWPLLKLHNTKQYPVFHSGCFACTLSCACSCLPWNCLLVSATSTNNTMHAGRREGCKGVEVELRRENSSSPRWLEDNTPVITPVPRLPGRFALSSLFGAAQSRSSDGPGSTVLFCCQLPTNFHNISFV